METEQRQPEGPLWEVEDVATYLNVSEAMIRARVLDNSIPFHRVGRLVRFKRSEIDAWTSSHRDSQKPETEGAA